MQTTLDKDGSKILVTRSHIKGVFLEEVVIALLKTAGYQLIESAGADPTLHDGPAGVEVLGRGGFHQLDAVADFAVRLPFSHPSRLVVEAKCYDENRIVGLNVVRNAVGVLKDINEYYLPGPSPLVPEVPKHYRFAIFSATSFSPRAQRYAAAHDVFIIPYGSNAHMDNLIRLIQRFDDLLGQAYGDSGVPVALPLFRSILRNGFSNSGSSSSGIAALGLPALSMGPIYDAFKEVDTIGGSFFGVASDRLLLHLIPPNRYAFDVITEQASSGSPVAVTVHYGESERGRRSWFLRPLSNPDLSLSFDLPEEMFLQYAEAGHLTRSAALQLKVDNLSTIDSIRVDGNHVTRVLFQLDKNWIEAIRSGINERRASDRIRPTTIDED